MQQGTGSRKWELMGFLTLTGAGLETKNVLLFLTNFFVSLILQAHELTVMLQYSRFNNQNIPFRVPTQTKRILLDCLVLVLPKGNAWKGMKRFVFVSYLAFKRLILISEYLFLKGRQCQKLGVFYLLQRFSSWRHLLCHYNSNLFVSKITLNLHSSPDP